MRKKLNSAVFQTFAAKLSQLSITQTEHKQKWSSKAGQRTTSEAKKRGVTCGVGELAIKLTLKIT